MSASSRTVWGETLKRGRGKKGLLEEEGDERKNDPSLSPPP